MSTGSNRKAKKIRAWIFDLDGVLTDTAEYHFLAWKRLAQEEGIAFTRKDNERLRGISRLESLQLLLRGQSVSREKMQEMLERKNGYYRQFILQMSKEDILPGALELIEELRGRGYVLAVASSSKNADLVMGKLGLKGFFVAVSDGHSVERAKPAPDIFLHAAKSIGVEAGACVVIEDAESGIDGALAAGMLTVGIGPLSRVGRADFCYPSVKDINVEDIV